MKVVRSQKPTEWHISAPIPPRESARPEQQPPQPRFSPTVFDQDTARTRRRKCLDHQYAGGNFVLSDEIRALCAPFAAEMTPMFAGPLAGRVRMKWVHDVGMVGEVPFAPEVAEVAGAVHALVLDVARILGDRKLGSSSAGRAAALAVVSGPALGPPTVKDEDLKSGAWVDVLAGHGAPLDVELAAQLGRVALPDGRVSEVSWALSEALGGASKLSMKLRNLERKIGESKLALQWDAGRAALGAEERERRSRQRLHAMGLS